MRIRKCIFWLVLLSCWSSLVLAGPAEDYEAGAKAFSAGNMIDAMAPLKHAADKGHAAAQALLAYILDIAEFNEEAVAYYRKSAEQGNADGQFGLASMYATGEGVAQNLDEARRLATLAAEQGNANAVVMLAQSYISGGLGLDDAARHGPEALPWIKRAADLDYLPALIALSAAYGSGQYGLTTDPKMVESLDARIHKVQGKTNAENQPKKK
mgnify:CR=1 FL=1